MIILLTYTTYSIARDMAHDHAGDAHNSEDAMVGNLMDGLFDQIFLPTRPYGDLDETTLGTHTSHLTISRPNGQRAAGTRSLHHCGTLPYGCHGGSLTCGFSDPVAPHG